jgi:ribosomal protein L11 methyltransferase
MAVAWTEVLVAAPVEWLELVAEALAIGPCTSVAFGPPSLGSDPAPSGCDFVRTYIAEADDTQQLRERIELDLARLSRASGVAELASLRVRFRRLPPEDFATSWRKSWKPLRVGSLAIVPLDWGGTLRAGDRRLLLEPGGAFGTGRHPTTRGCLRAIQAHVRPGERVLDAGCGSGILAVASVLCGAASALGFDNDTTVLPYANELALQNGVASACEFRAGAFEVLTERDRDFDGCLANIYADLIQAHARDLSERLRPGGWFAFSGCVSSKREATLAALAQAKLELRELSTRGRWDTFVGVRASSPARG